MADLTWSAEQKSSAGFQHISDGGEKLPLVAPTKQKDESNRDHTDEGSVKKELS